MNNKATSITGSLIKRLILHFNVDKTIVMKDSIGYNNTELFVALFIKFLVLI